MIYDKSKYILVSVNRESVEAVWSSFELLQHSSRFKTERENKSKNIEVPSSLDSVQPQIFKNHTGGLVCLILSLCDYK